MTRVNERIRAPKVRVVLPNGEQVGIMNTKEAVEKAKAYGFDLVEVTSTTDPPIARICDYGKWKYEQSKLKKNSVKTTTKLKEIKFRVRTEEHDYNIKMARTEKFLSEGHKVRMVLQFRGRENAHKEIGVEVMEKIRSELTGMAQAEQAPRISGRIVGMSLMPLPKDQQKPKFMIQHADLVDQKAEGDDDVIDEEIIDEVSEKVTEKTTETEDAPENSTAE